jgi:S1-C subfamily serine protease
MTCQFECPFCQTAIQAETVCTESAVECPACGQSFIVESPPEPVRVQARAVPAPPRQQMVPAHPSPPKAAHHAHPPQHPPRRSSARREEARAKAMFLTLLVGGPLLIAGLVWAAVSLKDAAKEKKLADWNSEVGRIPQAEDPFSAAIKVTEEEKRREAESQKLAADATKAWQESQEREKQAQARQKRAIITRALAAQIFNGNTAVAEEAAKEFEAAEKDTLALFSDGILDNEPADVMAHMEKLFVERMMANQTIRTWAQGRSFRDDVRRILGEGGGLRGPDGKPVDPKTDLGKMLAGKLNEKGSGSGFWISADGWLITNAHVVQEAATVEVRIGEGNFVSARVVKSDKEKDLALLKAEAKPAVWLPFTSGEAKVGRSVVAAGFPRPRELGLECKITSGEINSLSGVSDNKNTLQCSAKIMPGNSGGPLLDAESGYVVGVIFATFNLQESVNVSYAVKAGVARAFVQSVPEARPLLEKSAELKHAEGAEATRESAQKAAVLILVKK